MAIVLLGCSLRAALPCGFTTSTDEPNSLINAIKRGHKNDPAKLVRITSEVSNDEVRFTVEDEGDGFDVKKVPHPRNPENLLKTSGRGVLFIQSIMDEAQYNGPGNRLTMVKRRASLFGDETVKLTPGE